MKNINKNISENVINNILYSLLDNYYYETSIDVENEIVDFISDIYSLDKMMILNLIKGKKLNDSIDLFDFSVEIKYSFVWLIKAFIIIHDEKNIENLKIMIETLVLLSTNLSHEYYKIENNIEINNLVIDGMFTGILNWIRILENKELINDMYITKTEYDLLLEVYHNDLKSILLQLVLYFIGITLHQMNDYKEFYNTIIKQLLKQLFKSKVIKIIINNNYNDIINAIDATNNTSLFQIIYAFDNGDLYNIRFDSKHEGINKYHFNIGSFGNKKQFFPYSLEEKNIFANFKTIRHGLNQFYFTEKEAHELLKKENANRLRLVNDREHICFKMNDDEISQYIKIFIGLLLPFSDVKNLRKTNLEKIYKDDIQSKYDENDVLIKMYRNIRDR